MKDPSPPSVRLCLAAVCLTALKEETQETEEHFPLLVCLKYQTLSLPFFFSHISCHFVLFPWPLHDPGIW